MRDFDRSQLRVEHPSSEVVGLLVVGFGKVLLSGGLVIGCVAVVMSLTL